MRYLGHITDPKDLVTKEYVDNNIPTELSDLAADATHRTVTDTEKQTWNNKGTYSKPSGGIPKTDLATAVQTSLGKADSALQSVPSTYRTAAAQDVIDAGKVSTTDYAPDTKTPDMTQAVGKDSNGKLWTMPGSGGGAETHLKILTTAGWIMGSDERYYQDVTVNGVTEDTLLVIVDVNLTEDTISEKIAHLSAWAGPSANEAIQGNGYIRFFTYDLPTVSIPIFVGVIG